MGSKGDPSRRSDPTEQDGDGRVSLSPLDPVTALRAFLAVDPESEPSDEAEGSVDESGGEPVGPAESGRDADAPS